MAILPYEPRSRSYTLTAYAARSIKVKHVADLGRQEVAEVRCEELVDAQYGNSAIPYLQPPPSYTPTAWQYCHTVPRSPSRTRTASSARSIKPYFAPKTAQ